MVDCDATEYGLMQVVKKGDDPFAVRYLASFLDRLLAETVRVRYDNEPSLVQHIELVVDFRKHGRRSRSRSPEENMKQLELQNEAIVRCRRVREPRSLTSRSGLASISSWATSCSRGCSGTPPG